MLDPISALFLMVGGNDFDLHALRGGAEILDCEPSLEISHYCSMIERI
jgi:hypothetical protein